MLKITLLDETSAASKGFQMYLSNYFNRFFFSEWKKNAPYEIGYPLLYSTLVFLPLIPFLCFLIPSKESLLQQVSMQFMPKIFVIITTMYSSSTGRHAGTNGKCAGLWTERSGVEPWPGTALCSWARHFEC